ncbi:branched-chain amino acid ABC transporter permease [Candidatus Poribacteria bacterium]|jgi:branched-chain amino acid transport system permease protein|nr:branched-chain amino acid ABC transporter permease [Candidatus Poribacteria bacterium]MBT5535374.1 branched-chain amino acid ABC transporter permease [Candidatus Poribacteria bacterium]MBT5714364.1 branched-chain amino acid ABC transporter permease [Candidatus Poribacteria bacterium]MBT7097545.1 branched-chain amino acid ABC transporter permease [Candidatus Poribacteria bacterium]MBT7804892.1 branched-chain amino acid ABC transporter permease [Candidatus Poribacteria bacterium]
MGNVIPAVRAAWDRWWRETAGKPAHRVGGGILLVLVVASLVAPLLPLPMQYRARISDIFLLCIVYSIVALALNIVTGYTGLLDLGVVAFASIGAYTATILYDRPWMQFPGSFIVVLIVGGLHAAVWGLIRGAPTLRLSGDYYAIVTFAFAEIIRVIIRSESWLTGGGAGFKNFPSINPWGAELVGGEYSGILKSAGQWEYPSGGQWFGSSPQFYYLCLLTLALAVGVMRRLEKSRMGRAWFAIKADETSAMTSGISLTTNKLNAFGISAFIAGVGGALIGFKTGTVSTNVFDFWFSVVVLCGLVLGGMGSIRGALIGTYLVYGLGEVLREQLTIGSIVLKVDDRARFLMFGALLVVVMVFRPQGFLPRKRSSADEPTRTSEPSDLYHLEDDA